MACMMAIQCVISQLWWEGWCTRHAWEYQVHLACDHGARLRGCGGDLTGCGSTAVMNASQQVSEAIEWINSFHFSNESSVSGLKEEICTQDDYSPCAFPYKMANRTYNACLRLPGMEDQGPQCPDKTALDEGTPEWWRKCGSGCPEGRGQIDLKHLNLTQYVNCFSMCWLWHGTELASPSMHFSLWV